MLPLQGVQVQCMVREWGSCMPPCVAKKKKKERKKENATIGLPKINSTEVKGSSPHEAIAWTSLPTTTQNWHLTTCLIVQQPSGLSRRLKTGFHCTAINSQHVFASLNLLWGRQARDSILPSLCQHTSLF